MSVRSSKHRGPAVTSRFAPLAIVSASAGSPARYRSSGVLAAATVATCAALLAGSPVFAQRVNLLQVEENNIPLGQPRYSPVEYINSGVISSTTTVSRYPGVTFSNAYTTGLTTSSVTYSDHADAVANAIFGSGAPGENAVGTVFTMPFRQFSSQGQTTSYPFYDSVLLNTVTTTGSIPLSLGPGVRVTNHSYVLNYLNDTLNVNAVRRADYVIARDNVVWVAAAVTGSNFSGEATGETAVSWRNRNGIAVRGGSDTLNASIGASKYPGRGHVDVWDINQGSFRAANVSGYAATWLTNANAAGNTDLADARVFKSALMTGATQNNFTPTTPNNLDVNYGAGQVSYANSNLIFTSARQTYAVATDGATTSVATGTVPAVSSPGASGQGWGLQSIPANSSRVVLVHFPGPVNSFGSTLNWFWTSQTVNGGTQLDTSDAGLIAPDLALSLTPVTWNAATSAYSYTAPINSSGNLAGQALFSDATAGTLNANDNVEHIYTSGSSSANLSPGTYALVLRNKSAQAVTAAVTYQGSVGSVPTWTLNGNGNWTGGASTNNWNGSFTPNGAGQTAAFGSTSVSAGSVVVTLGISPVVGTLSFSGTTNYTLNPTLFNNNPLTSLTLNNAAFGAASIQVSGGAHTITARLNNSQAQSNFTFSNNASLTVSTLANSSSVNVSGPGTLAISGSVIASSTATGSVTVGPSGRLRLTNSGSPSAFTTVFDQAAINLAGTSTANRGVLEVTGNTTLPRGTNRPNVLLTNSVTIAGSGNFGFLDLGASDLIVRGGSAQLATLRQYVSAWYQGGTPVAQGIGTSLGLSPSSPYALSVFLNTTTGGLPFFSSYDGVSLAAGDVLVKFTYKGDTNLDGVVNGIDLANVIEGLSTPGANSWAQGDLNYDGQVTLADLAIYNFGVANQGATGLGGGSATFFGVSGAVPEPGTLGLLAGGLPILARRRRTAGR